MVFRHTPILTYINLQVTKCTGKIYYLSGFAQIFIVIYFKITKYIVDQPNFQVT
jgi:uncharacterized membrane protein